MFIAFENKIVGACRRSLRNEFLLNRVVIVMDDLNRDLEFVELGLHQLLCAGSRVVEAEFYSFALHDFLSLFDGLLLPFFNNFPELI